MDETIETMTRIVRGYGHEKLGLEERTFDSHTKWAATYYTLLISNFPVVSKTEFFDKSEEAKHKLNQSSLDIAREILLKNGLIAKIILPNEGFGSEPTFRTNGITFNHDH
jgi:hypothetical protein